jgi:hypothetical protein
MSRRLLVNLYFDSLYRLISIGFTFSHADFRYASRKFAVKLTGTIDVFPVNVATESRRCELLPQVS